jgi:hypothetical protein
VGNAKKFDFDETSSRIPKVDLPDLRSFFESMLELSGRRPQRESDGSLRFRTPVDWLEFGIEREYSGLLFERGVGPKSVPKVLGVGNRLMDIALRRAGTFESVVAALPASALKNPLVVLKVSEKTTGKSGVVHTIVAAVEIKSLVPFIGSLVKDWELLIRLNGLTDADRVRSRESGAAADSETVVRAVDEATAFVKMSLSELDAVFTFPLVEDLVVLWPQLGST